jgi:hypothetical protein
MDDLDNPKRRSKGQPSDYTSANNYGFGAASTNGNNAIDVSAANGQNVISAGAVSAALNP